MTKKQTSSEIQKKLKEEAYGAEGKAVGAYQQKKAKRASLNTNNCWQ